MVRRGGGAAAIRRCGPVRANQPMKAMVGWRLDVPLAGLADPPRAPAAVFQAPPGYAGEPPTPRVPGGLHPRGPRRRLGAAGQLRRQTGGRSKRIVTCSKPSPRSRPSSIDRVLRSAVRSTAGSAAAASRSLVSARA